MHKYGMYKKLPARYREHRRKAAPIQGGIPQQPDQNQLTACGQI
ncbi:hypothetical protein BN1012_Phect654 [Candidatus Phaeomarinobacter ectocarpi]|uniref:Uncharacterized protein n=1 Tax=Candidatus Phaeomarinibacter ectocarpi TaxID=1458461 RepID=X5M707_9HYPH|nr:hypothetical protein BN1012_Phect654 [Candidatus Phaeomarinobacter ectocarpi]